MVALPTSPTTTISSAKKPVDAENMTSLIVQKKTIVTTLDYYKLLWTDKVHADAAATTVFVLDGFYQHHVHIADHMPLLDRRRVCRQHHDRRALASCFLQESRAQR